MHLCYVEAILCIYHDTDDVLIKLNRNVPLKPGSICSPDMHCGSKLKHMQVHNGIWAWSMILSKHVQDAVRICEEYVVKHLSKITDCQRG